MITWLGTDHHGKPEVYIHVEVQGQHDANFPERLFTYNYRLYDRYRRPVASLAVLADGGENWKPTHFGYQRFGCEVGIRFPTVKILDYADQAEALLADPDPIALVSRGAPIHPPDKIGYQGAIPKCQRTEKPPHRIQYQGQ
ncbi:hypothetical protein ACCAA_1740009 [Candidatus Accumulibacter aalborgensis]|uniref:Transposase n=1 Tax=Candidatus Accumulibacter aalborgensis TaxID=1860102 RepID=A0A1A8XHN6_9PROT|nr:Rpn family recombination-promoting nuclease/putative transposase [Candidatus Accumulibacter aalborgensis]SBT04670.1 hypothetical protein ACCAA_1740009 [Candidatus Accumulibacter aalborgensis]